MEFVGKNHPEIMKNLNEYMPQSVNKVDESFLRDYINPDDLPPCIFLDENNRCSIYSVRPAICRGYGVTEKCAIINNEKLEFPEKSKMYIETTVISRIDGVGSQRLKRPYPLFYWFAVFLEDMYYYLTMEKVKKISNTPNDAYYEFTKIIQSI